MTGKMALGKNFEAFATFKAGDGLFFYRLTGFLRHFCAVHLHWSFAFSHGADALSHFLNKGGDLLFAHYPYAGLCPGNFQRLFQIIIHSYLCLLAPRRRLSVAVGNSDISK